uniref:Uncharacterized protein MANES_11G137000 n=1 Tax=Rhizophora mucronata TaxID=61149 RepID=A0A2P2ILP4_RHIMU
MAIALSVIPNLRSGVTVILGRVSPCRHSELVLG